MRYVASLDGIRAFAVAIVVIYHTWPNAFPGGWLGVDIFFVLSGYLITNALKVDANLPRFYMKRVLRLLPALVVMITLVGMLTPFRNVDPFDVVKSSAAALFYGMNWVRAFGLDAEGVFGHTWSLAIEEQFYLLWPLAFLALRDRVAPVWAAIAVIILWRVYLVMNGAGVDRVYNGFDTHSGGLLFGCALAMLGVQSSIAARRLVIVPIFILAVGVMTLSNGNSMVYLVGLPVITLCAGWILVAASSGGSFQHFLSLQPFVYIGRISYGIYLWHFPIILLGRAHIPEPWWFVMPVAGVACAVASYHLVEVPFLRLKSRLNPLPAVRNLASQH